MRKKRRYFPFMKLWEKIRRLLSRNSRGKHFLDKSSAARKKNIEYSVLSAPIRPPKDSAENTYGAMHPVLPAKEKSEFYSHASQVTEDGSLENEVQASSPIVEVAKEKPLVSQLQQEALNEENSQENEEDFDFELVSNEEQDDSISRAGDIGAPESAEKGVQREEPFSPKILEENKEEKSKKIIFSDSENRNFYPSKKEDIASELTQEKLKKDDFHASEGEKEKSCEVELFIPKEIEKGQNAFPFKPVSEARRPFEMELKEELEETASSEEQNLIPKAGKEKIENEELSVSEGAERKQAAKTEDALFLGPASENGSESVNETASEPVFENGEKPPDIGTIPALVPEKNNPVFSEAVENTADQEQEIVVKLKRLFPDHIIYADQYLKKVGKLSFPIYKLAKAAGVGRVQWLEEHGFLWKETGYIEDDMELRQILLPKCPGDPTQLAAYVFERFPLAGQYRLDKAEEECVYQAASQIVRKILDKQRITMGDESVLVLATVQLLRNWSTDTAEESSGQTFWNYIYLQFGFNPQKSGNASQRLYQRFRLAVVHTLQRFRRFLAPEATTQRYYTSLMLHAMAPVQSLESLFNILFDFYGKNLGFHYVAEDVSYKTFTQGMQSRWNPSVHEEMLHLRSDIVSSGLKVLFQERPGYMTALCENLVKKMDALLRDSENELDPDRDYWDYLLLVWYRKKSAVERAQVQSDRRASSNEYVAVSPDRIIIRYGMEKGKIGVVLPQIRLAEVQRVRPVLYVYQDDTCVFEDELAVTGDELSMTTRARFISLEEMAFDFDCEPHLAVEILYGKQVLYRSDKKLWRDFVLLDEKGQDRVPKEGSVYLFAGNGTKVAFFAGEDILQEVHPGQLYRFSVNSGIEVAVNGIEIFQDKTAGMQFRYHTNQRPIEGFYVLHQGKRCSVFTKPFSLLLRLPKGEDGMRYQLVVNGQSQGMATLDRKDDAYCVSVDSSSEKICSVSVRDLLQGTVKFQLDYMLLPECEVELDMPFYRAGVDQVSATVAWGENQYTAVSPLMQDADSIFLSLEGMDAQFELEVPSIQCSLGEQNAFMLPNVLWHEKLSSGQTVFLKMPEEWEGKLLLDGEPVPVSSIDGKFELGNQLRAKKYTQPMVPLSLSMYNSAGQTVEYVITRIVLQPMFLEPPLTYQDGRLLWCVKENFIGSSDTVFQISCQLGQDAALSFTVNTTDQVLEENMVLENGMYPYQVMVRKRSLFSQNTGNQLVFEGNLYVGDPHEQAFFHQEILVRDAICWDFEQDSLKNVAMKIGCGVITKLKYVGMDVASGEIVSAPHYQGTLCYIDSYGRYKPFNSSASQEYEQVNPVNVWIINDHLLILHCVTEDAVYIDTRYSSIVNRNPNRIMTKVEQRDRLMIPDYFEYRTRKV